MASPGSIRSAYRRKALQYHPDTNLGVATAAEQFKQLHAAYAVLKDPARRAAYNAVHQLPRSTASLQTADPPPASWAVIAPSPLEIGRVALSFWLGTLGFRHHA